MSDLRQMFVDSPRTAADIALDQLSDDNDSDLATATAAASANSTNPSSRP
ncbi:hypothetical protein [Frigoribacterium sp. Leaf172]|nr:hypothetical protein [Frigoribacterium sp. Leaf172]